MADANIIISAILFPQSVVTTVVKHIVSNHRLMLSQYTVDEIHAVFNQKFPHKMHEMERFMEKLAYELFTLKKIDRKKYPHIRDMHDLPVLASAIESHVDLLITGDKDFDEVVVKPPQIINPRTYIDTYMA